MSEVLAEEAYRKPAAYHCRGKASGIRRALAGKVQAAAVAVGGVCGEGERHPDTHVTTLIGVAVALIGDGSSHIYNGNPALCLRNLLFKYATI